MITNFTIYPDLPNAELPATGNKQTLSNKDKHLEEHLNNCRHTTFQEISLYKPIIWKQLTLFSHQTALTQ